MNRALEGKVAAVTGASRGIGLVVARALAVEGASVALLARDKDRLALAADGIADSFALRTDVGDPDSVRDAFAQIRRRHGHLDLLVNNAAVAWPHTIEASTDAQLQAEVATNLLGPIYAIREAVPLLRAAGGGHIVNVSTESVLDPFPHLLVYAATKAALETLSAGLVHELKRERIRVTLLRAGRTDGSEFRAHWDPDAAARAEQDWIAGGFRGRISAAVPQPPERIAEAVLFAVTRPEGSMIDVVNVRACS